MEPEADQKSQRVAAGEVLVLAMLAQVEARTKGFPLEEVPRVHFEASIMIHVIR